ncbi:hypothetical protein BH23ACT3_BH23ACT3_12000 [soil metagenome]
MPDRAVTFSIVNAIAVDHLDALLAELDRQEFQVVRLDGRGATDKDTFLARADTDLPRPDDLHPHNWDALADTLWNGLIDLAAAGHHQIAVVWTAANELARSDLQDFVTAVDVLVQVARDVEPSVIVCLVGDGPEYRHLGG